LLEEIDSGCPCGLASHARLRIDSLEPCQGLFHDVSHLVRAAIAKAMVRLDPGCDEREHVRTRWPDDPTAPLVLRAASQPATLAANPALGHTLVADLIATIGPTGAGERLLQAGLQLVFGSASAIYVSGLEAAADQVSFVREGP
jgi:hypothetical protein